MSTKKQKEIKTEVTEAPEEILAAEEPAVEPAEADESEDELSKDSKKPGRKPGKKSKKADGLEGASGKHSKKKSADGDDEFADFDSFPFSYRDPALADQEILEEEENPDDMDVPESGPD